MNKRIVTTLAIVIAFVISLGIYLAVLFPANTVKTPQTRQEQNKSTPNQSASQSEASRPGTYEAYSEETFAATKDTRRILFFHASWCPQCRQLDKEIGENKILSGISILKVDYDTSQQLRSKYGVTLQTTFVEVDSDGNKLKSIVAYNEPTYKNLVAQLDLHE